MIQVGKNTPSGEMLTSFIERVEHIRAEKKILADDESAVMAEAKAQGFVPSILRYVIKRRALKPHDLQEADAIADTYMMALGMTTETPLFRQVGMMSVDVAQREAVIDALKHFTPMNGSIVVEAPGGAHVRLTRDIKGDVSIENVKSPEVKAPASATFTTPKAPKEPPPDATPESAETLGREAFEENKAIISNPFPFGDPRRARFDAGWRKASGSDGMGPDD